MERVAGAVLVASIATWATLAGSHPGIGTMGQGPIAYLAMWTAMTAAMMLSPLVWFAYGYAGATRTASLACGYAFVWLLAGAGALALASAVDQLAHAWPRGVPWAGGLALLAAGVYQLSPLKQRCLA